MSEADPPPVEISDAVIPVDPEILEWEAEHIPELPPEEEPS